MKKNKVFWINIFFIISLCLFSVSFFRLETDYLWHIKAGEYMFNNGIIKHDVFSWYLNGKYWMSHEWLFEIIIYSLKVVFGNLHLFIYCFICSLSLLLILFLGNKENVFKNNLFSFLWFVLFLLIIFSMQARPHLISYCFIAFTVYCLYDLYKNEKSRKIYFLPILTVLWSNIHGGSSNFGYILCFIFFICGLFNFSFSKIKATRFSKLQLIKYFSVFILCMFAVCINIHGFKMFIYPYQNMMDKVMIENIIEWRETSLNELSSYIYICFALFIFLIMLFSKKKIELIDFVLFGLCVFLGMKSIRFWYYTYIIMSFVVFNYIKKSSTDKLMYNCMIFYSVLIVLFFCINSKKLFNPKYEYFLEKKDIEYIKKIDSKRLFNMYNYGGELIYNDIKVFIDGRADLYSKYNYKDYLKIAKLEGDYVSIINKYNFDYMIVDSNYSINTYLKYSNDYNLVYTNKKIRIYKKMN